MSSELRADRARIYVSFADEDRPRAMQLVRWLNDSGWRVTADDRHGFAAGERWSPSPRLEFADVILCVITPRWLASDFCRHEHSYCAKRGRFVLPVICELSDIGLLPPAIRALPRVDLRGDRMMDYLALKQVLTQAGTQVARAAAGEAVRSRRDMLDRMLGSLYFWPALAAIALAVIALVAFLAWR
jgi:TIR domain